MAFYHGAATPRVFYRVTSDPRSGAGLVAVPGDTALNGTTWYTCTGTDANDWELGLSGGAKTFIDVRDFGAVGDGTTDDTVALTNAFDSLKSGGGWLGNPPSNGGTLVFPKGYFRVTAPIPVYSFIHAIGQGAATVIFTDDTLPCLLQLTETVPAQVAFSMGVIEHMMFSAPDGTGCWAIGTESSTCALNSRFSDLYCSCPNGINLWHPTDLTNSAQKCIIGPMFFTGGHWRLSGPCGNVGHMLRLAGNDNLIQCLDKEGGYSDASATEFILIGNGNGAGGWASGNWIRNTLIEGGAWAPKSGIRFWNGGFNVLDGFWYECSPVGGTEAFQLVIQEQYGFTARGALGQMYPYAKVKVEDSRNVHLDVLNLDGGDYYLDQILVRDEVSTITIDTVYSRYGADAYPYGERGLTIKQVEASMFGPGGAAYDATIESTLKPPTTPVVTNLLTNPHFDSGSTGWSFITNGTAVADTYPDSPFSSGKCIRLDFSASTSTTLYCYQTVPNLGASGVPFTVTMKGTVTGLNAMVSFYLGGGGLPAFANSWGRISSWSASTKPYFSSVTIRPSAPGPLVVGFAVANASAATVVTIDGMTFSPG